MAVIVKKRYWVTALVVVGLGVAAVLGGWFSRSEIPPLTLGDGNPIYRPYGGFADGAYGNGRWLVVFSTSRKDSSGYTGDDILVSRSQDGGTTWSVPQPIALDPSSTTTDCYFPAVRWGGGNHFITAWLARFDLPGITATQFEIRVSHSWDSGATWTPPHRLPIRPKPYDFDGYWLHLSTDQQANWVISLSVAERKHPSYTAKYGYCLVSRDDGKSWSEELEMPSKNLLLGHYRYSNIPSSSWKTQITSGILFAAATDQGFYMDIPGTQSRVFVTTSKDGGVTWTGSRLIGSTEDGIPGEFVRLGAQEWGIAWVMQPLQHKYDIARCSLGFSMTTDNGKTWTTQPDYTADASAEVAQYYSQPVLACDQKRHIIAVWNWRKWTGNCGILVSQSKDNGATWTPPRELRKPSSALKSHEYRQKVAYGLFKTTGLDYLNIHSDMGDWAWRIITDANGTWLLLFYEYGGKLSVLRSTDNGATWKRPE
ncbi:MAG: glycoside hydrolase [Candidatus Sumerlaeaceae bacterium]|nr:glycoside hydrolase [Candidatus Sumerlaeaceae bacterium]